MRTEEESRAATAALKKGIKRFTGTEQYHGLGPLFRRAVATDGMLWVMENAGAGAHWLFHAMHAGICAIEDKLAGRRPDLPAECGRLGGDLGEGLRGMQFWTLDVRGAIATLTCREDSGIPEAFRLQLAHTDFPEGKWDFFAQYSHPLSRWVVMLPNEY